MNTDWNNELTNMDSKIQERRNSGNYSLKHENYVPDKRNGNRAPPNQARFPQQNRKRDKETVNSTTIHIPERFKRIITLHVVKNLMTQDTIRAPLLLGIHGPSGDGKTYQCEKVLEELGAKTFLISGGQLESHQAGEPAQLIRTAYLNAGRCMQKREYPVAVVLINDIDTGVGSWGDMVQYTINRQTVFGELMHLVDYPTSVEGRQTKRVPIIITGNDFTKLYEPLVRAGRMTAFEWNPTLDEKTKIVSRIFPEINHQECTNLVREFETQPLAFFPHLKSTLIDDELWQTIQGKTIQKVISSINRSNESDLLPSIQYQRLKEAGKNILQSGQLINHLGIA